MMRKIVVVLVAMLMAATSLRAQDLLKPGMPAPDFEGVTVDGRPYHLYESQAERIVVCFWAVDCDYCHDFLRELRRHVDLENDYELVTFALADSPRQVKRKARCLRVKGWHFYDEAGWDSQPFVDYDVTSTPTVFLIDRDKKIICQAFEWEDFER